MELFLADCISPNCGYNKIRIFDQLNLESLLSSAVNRKASDLHLIADASPTFRISGKLTPAEKTVLSSSDVRNIIYSFLSQKQIEIFEKEKELDLSFEIAKLARFRVNIHFQRNSIAAAFRTIPKDIPSIESLNLPQAVYDFTKEPRGLILVTGATGSGKSTTQAAMIDLINNTKTCHIITIEDPIEFLHENKKCTIEQREVGSDTLSFSNALNRVLRQDPDVILIGEMRDLDTISTAVTAAETGHLVISTLHTNDAVQTIDRIVDVFPPHQQNQIRMQLSLSIQGIISQQLIPKADGSGLILAAEVLKATTGIRNIIRKGTTPEIYSMVEIGAKYGMQTMDHSLKNLYKSGAISYEDAIGRAINAENLEKMLAK